MVAVLLTGFVGVAMARITNPPSSSAAITAIGPTGQTSDGPTTTFATSTTGTDFTITGSGDTITFNAPTASASNRGFLSTADWTAFNAKEAVLSFVYPLIRTANSVSTDFSTTTTNVFSAKNSFGSPITSIETNGRINVAAASTTPQRGIVYATASCTEALLTDGATVTWDLSAASCGRVLLGGNRTLDITNAEQAIGQRVQLVACANGGAFSFTSWDTLIRWPANTAPTQTATANRCDVFSGFVSAGTSTPIVLLGASLGF